MITSSSAIRITIVPTARSVLLPWIQFANGIHDTTSELRLGNERASENDMARGHRHTVPHYAFTMQEASWQQAITSCMHGMEKEKEKKTV